MPLYRTNFLIQCETISEISACQLFDSRWNFVRRGPSKWFDESNEFRCLSTSVRRNNLNNYLGAIDTNEMFPSRNENRFLFFVSWKISFTQWNFTVNPKIEFSSIFFKLYYFANLFIKLINIRNISKH